MNKNVKHFCKYCGAEFSKGNIHCPSCGKGLNLSIDIPKTIKSKYFIVSVLCNVALIFAVFSTNDVTNSFRDYSESLNQQNATLAQENAEIRKYFNEYLEYGSQADIQLSAYQLITAIITESGEKRHTYNCPTIKSNTPLVVLDKELAKELGYSECLVCEAPYRRKKLSDDFLKNSKKYFTEGNDYIFYE